MEMLPVTSITAGTLAFVFFILSVRTIQARRSTHTSVGDGGNDLMLRRMRSHANFAEYIPLLLIILLVLELQAIEHVWLMLYGIVIVVGRVLHAWGIASADTPGWARICGMVCTFVPLTIGAAALLWLGATAL